MHHILQDIERYLMCCRELTAFGSQYGWIDKNSLRYEIVEQNDNQVIAFVQFDEILVRDSASAVSRIPCQGHLCLTLDHYGQVIDATLR